MTFHLQLKEALIGQKAGTVLHTERLDAWLKMIEGGIVAVICNNCGNPIETAIYHGVQACNTCQFFTCQTCGSCWWSLDDTCPKCSITPIYHNDPPLRKPITLCHGCGKPLAIGLAERGGRLKWSFSFRGSFYCDPCRELLGRVRILLNRHSEIH